MHTPWHVKLGLGPLLGRTVSRSISRSDCGLRKSLGSLSVDGQRLCCTPFGWLAWGIPSLETTGCWEGQNLVLITQARCLPPAKFQVDENSNNICHQILWSQFHSHFLSTQEILRDQQVSLAPGFYKVTALPWFSVCMMPCLHFFSLSALELLHSSPACHQAKWSGGSSSWCQTPELGGLTWGTELTSVI